MEQYNIIPLGDNCIIAESLKQLNIRKNSYPFDWITHIKYFSNTNIMYNFEILDKLMNGKFDIKDFLGNAFINGSKFNNNNIWFPHDNEENIDEIYNKYKRRFERLHNDILTKENIFVLLTRHYIIDEKDFDKIVSQILSYNNANKIVFICGSKHNYLHNIKYKNVLAYQHIYYDIKKISNEMEYDTNYYRPMVRKYLYNLFLQLGFPVEKNDKMFEYKQLKGSSTQLMKLQLSYL
jgi:hypothetical protein